MGIYGQDWASYQPAQPNTAGLSFAFVKITEGMTYTNPEWQSQRDTARAAGLVVGYYHYPDMTHAPETEADHFLSLAQPPPGEMLCLDWEGYDATNSAVPHATQLAYKEAFLRHLKAAAPHQPVGLYCNLDYWQNIDTTGFFQDFLWIATSGLPAGQPGISAGWLFHQYSSNGVDQDYCHLGSTAELRSWALGFQPTQTPTPQPTGPAWPGEYLSVRTPMLHDGNVQTWQQRMRDRGWAITVDGWYGPDSASICRQFQQDSTAHGWPLAVDGVVGPDTWRATWQRPVS
ncbi:GH25 family lysozyme [Kitasatospora sp. NPDC052896]|uniref:GH25 family lysozyme n=1 Tax=Kitasatospora sp. NPDC052896 TaxID=3364061 RepID=UPI0037CB5379